MTATLYHNPRCSKSRQAKELLEQQGIEFNVREYLKEPLNSKELKMLIELLNRPAHDLLRSKEAEYKEHELHVKSTTSEIINAIISSPKLLERPILTTAKGARIGRPTEALLEIL